MTVLLPSRPSAATTIRPPVGRRAQRRTDPNLTLWRAAARSAKLTRVIARTLQIADLHDADELDRETWSDSTPLERLAAVEAIRRATLALYGTSVQRVERILAVADAPSRSLRRRGGPRGRPSRSAKAHGRPRRLRGPDPGER